MTDPLGAALAPVVTVLEALDVVYYIGGSVASMAHSEHRETADVDIVADLRPEHVPPLVNKLADGFYVDEQAIGQAIRRHESFNVFHLNTMYKVDVFPLKPGAYDQVAAARRQRETVATEPALDAFVASPEDVVLAKLRWFRLGGDVSDRQWRDITGVLKVQVFDLDFDYLQRWALELGVSDLLERALQDAGIPEED